MRWSLRPPSSTSRNRGPDMNLLQALKLRCFRFGGDSRGSVPTEGVMAFTFLIWWYISSFQFFDAYRQKNINLKAAYTIADLISRETEMIDAGYIDGLNTVFDYLTYSRKPTWIRVSSVYWDEDTDSYRVWWSYSAGGHSVHTGAPIGAHRNRIPLMASGG